jgi:hypothetical protein
MQPNVTTASGASAKATYEPINPRETGIVMTAAKPSPLAQLISTGVSLGATVIPALSPVSVSTIDWYGTATTALDLLSYWKVLGAREAPRFLTLSEQAVFHSALRRSAKIIHKAKRIEI